jgi:arylsulfatase A-like enzyme
MSCFPGSPEIRRAGRRTRITASSALSVLSVVLLQALFSAAAVASESTAATSRASGSSPNIIWIMADDLGYGDLGCYGQQKIQTPQLDRMAAEGLRFTQFYAGSTVCAPSRCVLMTGMHNGHGRIRDNLPLGVFLRPDDVTVAEVMKQAGYVTGMIGKWGLGDAGSFGVPTSQGFDEFYGHLTHTHAHFYYPQELWQNTTTVMLQGNRGNQRKEYTQDLFTQRALTFLEQQRQRPFFLYLAYTTPHWSDFDRTLVQSQDVPSDVPYTDRDWPQVEKNYAAMVTRLDGDIGRILDALKQHGLDQNTIVCFTSDNGPSAEKLHSVDFFDSNGPLRGHKRTMYEGGIRVPLIVRAPGRVPAGVTTDAVHGFQDLLPTCAELAGLPVPIQTDGISMVAALQGQTPARVHEFLYWDYGHTRDGFQQGIRLGTWKGVRNGKSGSVELYDLARDVSETQDVAADHPDVLKQIDDLLRTVPTASADYPIK